VCDRECRLVPALADPLTGFFDPDDRRFPLSLFALPVAFFTVTDVAFFGTFAALAVEFAFDDLILPVSPLAVGFDPEVVRLPVGDFAVTLVGARRLSKRFERKYFSGLCRLLILDHSDLGPDSGFEFALDAAKSADSGNVIKHT
jgi:hypothetical protein